jgi:hypothetical protein
MLTLYFRGADMPDDDRIPRHLTGSWRKVLRCLSGRETAERTADVVTSALAETLRATKGVPGLRDIAAQMREAAATGRANASRIPAPGDRHHVPTDVAERAAAALAACMPGELALVSPAEAALRLARRLLEDLAFHYGFDRMAPLLLRDGTYAPGELRSLLAEILASEQVSKLAKRLLAHPNGSGLVTPPRQRRSAGTEGILHTSLTEI